MVTLTADVSERAVLGAALRSTTALASARMLLTPDDFAHPAHAELWGLLADLADAGAATDAQTVVSEFTRRGRVSESRRYDVLVFDLVSESSAGTVGWHAAQLRAAARARAIKAEYERLGQALDESADTDALLDRAAAASVALAAAADETDDSTVDGLSTWGEFVASRRTEARWLAPGLLRRGDCVLILSPPGAGKSALSRQMCLSLSAGRHPFRPSERFAPVRTLLVDLENAEDQLAEEAEPLLTYAQRTEGWDDSRAWVWPHPQGLDIRTRAGARLLEQAIAKSRCDVLAMGSLYQAYRKGADSWDEAAEDVQHVLSSLRSRYGLALWLEHHSTRAQAGGHSKAPYGGTSWERWPTHGRWLARADEAGRVYRLAATFRGDRGARDFPPGLLRGTETEPWWTAVWDETEIDAWIDGRPA